MQIGSAISAPTRSFFPAGCVGAGQISSLNPQRRHRNTVRSLPKHAPTCRNLVGNLPETRPRDAVREHLRNLDRILAREDQAGLERESFVEKCPENYENSGRIKESRKANVNPLLRLSLVQRFLNERLSIMSPRWGSGEKSPENETGFTEFRQETEAESQVAHIWGKLLNPANSPRNKLGEKWLEYHGKNNWAGLLDPLDENLRREIVRYGDFVQAAYEHFYSDSMTSREPTTPSHVAVPDRSYRVTKSLYATSSLGVPDWFNNVVPDWMTRRSSWIGYIAVCDDEREIARLGRRDIVVALRGTATCMEWAENFRDILVNLPTGDGEDGNNNNNNNNNSNNAAKVECGFWSLYKTHGKHIPSLSEEVVAEVSRLVREYKGQGPLSITITGHSLGGALALLAADEIGARLGPQEAPPIAVFSFGGPRVGNNAFGAKLEGNGIKVLRVVNSRDVVPQMPGVLMNEGLRASVHAALPIADGPLQEWTYSHVGCELRLDSRQSPYLRPDADVAACHDLEAYLHLVDGFLASNCPFRASAKRWVQKLRDQSSNAKRLCKSKALRVTLENMESTPICLASPS
ncbi:phospholipase A1-Ibeta2, chloroplastic [Amborella trichopoda]|uniref:Fungal lipase-type domain-containing protein n=1 Tax=Amborella trichopoda TaxID=13333 RepID=W1NX72_AMBTC|nr:phospholipase A1-Ibeta2, chloroplastic [Amborella trichopoda]ERN00248.1 hypothetical protein AMTR_s00111p00135120 [Amborella trichopoda]|eukprot:XP_006837394.1 phospholipase A1-Ibeta2, chloroplastic [Amborella trichopoda]